MKRLPDTEFSVMQGLWSAMKECPDSPISTVSLKELLEKERSWNMSALQTVLSRLEEKCFVKSEKSGRNRFYTVLISEEDYLTEESRSFFGRIGGKKLTSLVAALYDNNDITDSDLEELKKFIDSKK